MIALISFLVVILFSRIIIRIGSVALEMTGLSKDLSSFQAQSAFSGAGFTTSESEYAVSHPARRKIIRILILLGSGGLASTIATLVFTFAGNTFQEAQINLIFLILGLILIYLFFRSIYIEKIMRKAIKLLLLKFTSLAVYDYQQLLGLTKGYSVGEIKVKENKWLQNRMLKDLKLNMEGVLVLAIYRKIAGEEKFIGSPDGDTELMAGDLLICYGPHEVIASLSERDRGIEGDKRHIEEIEMAEIRKIDEIQRKTEMVI
ncbi:TrkA C-terminal domain-containing protein [Methanohalophilus sp.]|uniref:potassium channel family protein n=1 Tax=Methanohalophilus sp. TaxID=1966352 RepID=UPI002601A08F|nr:TrkA C-terminal domain-containing protein [Methanohalophilus sp.]MDK2891972.1 hypothetical protein [Methanohalophilus sp.]